MITSDVHIYAIVRVKVVDVPQEDPVEAVKVALEGLDLHALIDNFRVQMSGDHKVTAVDYSEDISDFLVDRMREGKRVGSFNVGYGGNGELIKDDNAAPIIPPPLKATVKIVRRGDETFDPEYLGLIGEVIELNTTNAGVGEFEGDPYIMVRFADGHVDGFWKEELEIMEEANDPGMAG